MLRDLARRKIARKIACRVSVPMQAKSNANSSEFECNFLISFDAGKTLKIVRGLTNCTQPSSVVYLLTCRICLNFVKVILESFVIYFNISEWLKSFVFIESIVNFYSPRLKKNSCQLKTIKNAYHIFNISRLILLC